MTILEAGQPGALVETGPTSSIFDAPTQRGHGRLRLRPVRLEAMAQVEPGFLEQRLIEISDLVRHGLRDALSALELGDFAIAQRVIEADDEVDRLCLALDRDAEILLVGKVVPARDIALVLASTRIARNLERMADQCVTIAKLVQAGGNDEPGSDAVRASLEEMGRRGERMLEAATDALSHRDVERARQLDELDNLVDDLNRSVVEQVLEIGGDRARREWGLRMVLVARALERIADNAVDIAEQVCYVVTGELREFSDASHPDERPGRGRVVLRPRPRPARGPTDSGTGRCSQRRRAAVP